MKKNHAPATSAVLAFGAGMGDLALMAHLLSDLKRRPAGGSVIIACSPAQAEAAEWLSSLELADEVVVTRTNTSGLARLVVELNRRRPLDNIILPHTLRSWRLPALLMAVPGGKRWSLGFREVGKVERLFMRVRPIQFLSHLPLYEQYAAAARPVLGISVPTPPEGPQWNAHILSRYNRHARRPVAPITVGLHLGSTPGREVKTLNPANWRPLLDILHARGASFKLFGGPLESSLALTGELKIPMEDLVGKLGVSDMASEIAQCALFVCNDGGPMHVAGLLDIPTIAYFGPTDPVRYRPMASRFFLLEPSCPCRHTSVQVGSLICPNPDGPVCRETVITQEVLNRIESWLGPALDDAPGGSRSERNPTNSNVSGP